MPCPKPSRALDKYPQRFQLEVTPASRYIKLGVSEVEEALEAPQKIEQGDYLPIEQEGGFTPAEASSENNQHLKA